MGADDYITKPFATANSWPASRPCCAASSGPAAPSIISFEEVIIDQGAMQLKVRGRADHHHGHRIPAAGLPARHRPRLQPGHLLDAVWGDARFVTRVRWRLRAPHPGEDRVDPENPRYLRTVRGAGYRSKSKSE